MTVNCRYASFQWIVESYNFSDKFRNFQQLTIRQVKENPYLCYKKDIQKFCKYRISSDLCNFITILIFNIMFIILMLNSCLSNMMIIEPTKPSYLTVTPATWEKIFRRQLPPSLPPIVNNVALEYSSVCYFSYFQMRS